MLRACREAIAPGGRVIIIDKLHRPLERNDPTSVRTLMSALNLAVMTGSRERPADEYAALLATAGFALADVARTPALQGELFLVHAEPR